LWAYEPVALNAFHEFHREKAQAYLAERGQAGITASYLSEEAKKKDSILNSLPHDLEKRISKMLGGGQIFSSNKKNYELEFIKLNNDSYISVLILERFLNSKLISQDSAKTHYNNFTKRVVNSPSGININQILKAPKEPAKVGEIAPSFNGPKPNGDTFYLEENLKKITLIDFWASWCKPCRIANPGLVNMYNKYKDKGLKIISVSLDRDKNQWIQAINDDGLYWDAHVSNLMFWKDPIAVLYKVNAIPATFLLDENGKIIEKNLRGIQLENRISELLN